MEGIIAMSLPVSTEMSIELSKKLKNNWDLAIADAEQQIQEAQTRIRTLKKSLATFQRLRDLGEPFPGEAKEQSEAKNDLAQK